MLSRIPMVHDREAGIHSAPRDKVPSESHSGHSCMEGWDGATVHHGKVGVINSNRVDPRRCPGMGNESEGQTGADSQADTRQIPQHNISNISEEQRRDPEVVELILKLEAGKATITESRTFIVIDGTLYYVPDRDQDPALKLVIPSQLRGLVLEECHDNCCHMGLDKTYDRIRGKYHWRGLYKDVAEYVSKCVTCKARNLKRELRPLQEMEEVRFPFEKIGIDTCGPHPTSKTGNKYLVTIICLYTGWPEIFPVSDKLAQTVATIILEEIIPRHACPLTILSDNGREFCNQIIDHICEVMRIYRIQTSTYHPAGNGATERFHRVWNDMVSKQLESGDDWDSLIPAVLTAYRTSINESRKHSPFYLLYGRDPILPLDTILQPRLKYMGEDYHKLTLQKQHQAFVRVNRHLRKARIRQKHQHDQTATVDREFEIGEPVFLYNPMRKHKLEKKWLPFYRVMEQTGPVNFVIRNQVDGTIKRVHSSRIQKANLEWEVPAPKQAERPLRATRFAIAPSTGGSTTSSSDNEDKGSENRRDPGPIYHCGPAQAESSDAYMEWESDDEIPLTHWLGRHRGINPMDPMSQGLKRDRHYSDSTDSEAGQGPVTRSKHKRINRIKGSNSNKKDSSNKESVKNLLEAIAALV